MIRVQYGEYEVDFSSEVRNSEYKINYTTKYGRAYTITGVRFAKVYKRNGFFDEAYVVDVCLNGTEDATLTTLSVFPKSLENNESDDAEAINIQLREISVLRTKILLNEDKAGVEVAEIKVSPTLTKQIEDLKSRLQSAEEKRIGFK